MDIEQIRKDTPGCHDKLFLNSAGSSLPPKTVNERIIEYLEEEERYGGYRLAEMKRAGIAGFYQEAALLLNTSSKNIAFTSSATESFARVLSAIPFNSGDVILTTDNDYVSSFLQFLSLKERFGVEIERIQHLENGDLDLEQAAKMMEQHQPKLVTLAHIPTSSGLVQDAEAIGKLCREHDCLFLLDACQSAGQLPLDVNQLNCDFLSATGRKFLRGPRGTGLLYVSDHALNQGLAPLFIDLRGATWTEPGKYELSRKARRFEQWEMPYALMMGLKEAIGYANQVGLENIARKNSALSNLLRKELAGLKGVQVYDRGSHKASIITFKKENLTIQDHVHMLQENNVFFSVTSRDSAIYDYTEKGVEQLIRLSPHYFNTEEEISDLAEIIEQI